MQDVKHFVGYLFGNFNKSPRSNQEFMEAPAVRAQNAHLAAFAHAAGWKPVSIVAGISTSRRKTFVSIEEFRSVVRLAKDNGCPVVLAGLSALLSSTNASLIDACIEKLDELDVPIVDATSGAVWAQIWPSDRIAFIRTSKVASMLKSEAIKVGLKDGAKRRSPPPADNRLRGSRSNAVGAARRAEVLRPFVEQFRETLPPGALISPL